MPHPSESESGEACVRAYLYIQMAKSLINHLLIIQYSNLDSLDSLYSQSSAVPRVPIIFLVWSWYPQNSFLKKEFPRGWVHCCWGRDLYAAERQRLWRRRWASNGGGGSGWIHVIEEGWRGELLFAEYGIVWRRIGGISRRQSNYRNNQGLISISNQRKRRENPLIVDLILFRYDGM